MNSHTHTSLKRYIPENQYRFYYEHLSNEGKNIYDKLLAGYLEHLRSISVKASNMNEVWDIHEKVCYDVPELFFIKSVKGSYNSLLSKVTIYPEYRFDFDTCEVLLIRMSEVIEPVVQKITSLSEREKVKQIHDFLTRKVTYKDIYAPYSHEAPGALIYGIAVCEGISKSFKYVCDRASLDSVVIIGNAYDSVNNPTSNGGHAWNIVFVDSLPYHIDVTFDYSLSDSNLIRYDYFLLSDSQIHPDHAFEQLILCNTEYEYYEKINCYAKSKRELQAMARFMLSPMDPLVIKMPSFVDDINVVAEILIATVSSSVSLVHGFQFNISMTYNPSRMIFQFNLSE